MNDIFKVSFCLTNHKRYIVYIMYKCGKSKIYEDQIILRVYMNFISS